MATDCPCGCGKTIKRFMRRTAERAVLVGSLSDVPMRMATICATTAPESAETLEEFSGLGMSYANAMLDVVHRGPRRRLPSRKALRDWESAAIKLLGDVKRIDPFWFAQWAAFDRNRAVVGAFA